MHEASLQRRRGRVKRKTVFVIETETREKDETRFLVDIDSDFYQFNPLLGWTKRGRTLGPCVLPIYIP